MSNLNIIGNKTVEDASSDTISVASNIATTIDGAANTITGAGGDNITVKGDNNTLTLPTPVVIAGGSNTKIIATSTATLNGQGELVSATKASVTVESNSTGQVNGDSNSFTVASNVYQSVVGDSNTFTGTTDDTFVIQGDSNSFIVGTGADLNFIQGKNETVTASHGTIFLGSFGSSTAPADASVTGSNDTINLVAEGSNLDTLTGNNNTISGSDIDTEVGGNGNVFNLTLDPNNENGNPGVGAGRLLFYGTNNTVNGSYATVVGLQNVPGTSNGSSGPVHDSVTVNGTNNQINFVANMTAEFGSTFNGDFLEDFSDVLKSAVIDFHDVSGLNSFKSVLDHATQVGTGMAANTFIAVGGNSLELYGVQMSQLSAHNFSFS